MCLDDNFGLKLAGYPRRGRWLRGTPVGIHHVDRCLRGPPGGVHHVGVTNVGYSSVTVLVIQDLIFNSFIIYLIWLFIRYKTIVENNYTIVFVANKCRTLI